MHNYEEMLIQLAHSQTLLSKRQQRKVKIETFIRLTERLSQDHILNERIHHEEPQIMEIYDACYQFLTAGVSKAYVSSVEEKAYYVTVKSLTDKLAKKFDIRPKGTYLGMYMVLGIAIGAGVGMAVSTSNPSFYSIGVSLGLVFGVSYGNSKEKSAIKAGKMY